TITLVHLTSNAMQRGLASVPPPRAGGGWKARARGNRPRPGVVSSWITGRAIPIGAESLFSGWASENGQPPTLRAPSTRGGWAFPVSLQEVCAMYSVVLMAALATSGETPDLGRRGGCHGCRGGCYGGCYGGYGWGCHGCYGGGYRYGGCYGGCYGGGYA